MLAHLPLHCRAVELLEAGLNDDCPVDKQLSQDPADPEPLLVERLLVIPDEGAIHPFVASSELPLHYVPQCSSAHRTRLALLCQLLHDSVEAECPESPCHDDLADELDQRWVLMLEHASTLALDADLQSIDLFPVDIGELADSAGCYKLIGRGFMTLLQEQPTLRMAAVSWLFAV